MHKNFVYQNETKKCFTNECENCKDGNRKEVKTKLRLRCKIRSAEEFYTELKGIEINVTFLSESDKIVVIAFMD